MVQMAEEKRLSKQKEQAETMEVERKLVKQAVQEAIADRQSMIQKQQNQITQAMQNQKETLEDLKRTR